MGKYQPFYDLDINKFAALRDDIALRGVVIPIIVDEDGLTIDGHQRRRAAAELHIPCPQTVIKGLTEDDKMALALALNAHRRHLSGAERAKAVGRLRALGWSIRNIAEVLEVGAATVHRDLAAAGVPDGTPDRVTGKDGRSYSSTQPERDEPPANVDSDGVITDDSTEVETETSGEEAGEAGTSDVVEANDDAGTEAEQSAPTSSPVPRDPTLLLISDLSKQRAEVAKWLAFDRHEQAIDAMTVEQRADYRSFLVSVSTRVNELLSELTTPSHLSAVK